MDHFTYASNLLNYIKTLKTDDELDRWVYKGKTTQVFSTPGGKWPPEGYLFQSEDKTYQFIIRSFPNEKGSYVVMESINLGRQLYNINLSDKKILVSKNNLTQLLESYTMTVGKGRKKVSDVKNQFLKQGIKTNIISEVDDFKPDWKKALLDILQGAINREIVKKKLQNEVAKNMKKTNYKKIFKEWLSQNYNDKNGTITSYIKAIDIISEIIDDNIFEIDDLGYLHNLYEDISNEQKIENGKYFYEKAPSYGNKGFYSAAMKNYIHYHQTKNTMTDEKLSLKFPLNQILFGPPGTGKTYHTINKAVEIINSDFVASQSRKDMKDEFRNLVEEGQVVFTTFHQSMSYEDFIEGIKPETVEDKDGNKNIIYEIKDGIFKIIADKAKDNWLSSQSTDVTKLSFEDAFTKLKEDWEENNDIKFSLTKKGFEFTILGFTGKSIKFKKSSGGISHTLSINTLSELYYNKRAIKKGGGLGIYYTSILNKLAAYSSDNTQKEELQNFVLIIDEINRGNVSQIFGELITLIEEDKRLGNDESLEITLPYSKEKFGVPPNLYIIGTMNTADRSVEALDTALRRRFSFEEMPPKPELLLSPSEMIEKLLWDYKEHPWEDKEYELKEKVLLDFLNAPSELWNERKNIWKKMNEDKDNGNINHGTYFSEYFTKVDFKNLLITINKRIEKLIDKDHAIGHAYFMGKNNETIVDSFYKNIIPLLQEYFFGDYGKIGLVLGKGFVKKKTEPSVFAAFDYENDYLERESYEIIDYRKPDILNNSEMTFLEAIKLLMN